jgi:hypothetical protein
MDLSEAGLLNETLRQQVAKQRARRKPNSRPGSGSARRRGCSAPLASATRRSSTQAARTPPGSSSRSRPLECARRGLQADRGPARDGFEWQDGGIGAAAGFALALAPCGCATIAVQPSQLDRGVPRRGRSGRNGLCGNPFKAYPVNPCAAAYLAAILRLRVAITAAHHPLVGVRAAVRGCRRVDGVVHVIVESPDGAPGLVELSATSAVSGCPTSVDP